MITVAVIAMPTPFFGCLGSTGFGGFAAITGFATFTDSFLSVAGCGDSGAVFFLVRLQAVVLVAQQRPPPDYQLAFLVRVLVVLRVLLPFSDSIVAESLCFRPP